MKGRGLPTVARASLHSCLITRQTGRAVRQEIQRRLADSRGPVVALLDFGNVSIIDFSCADEVVAKLAGFAMERPVGAGPFVLLSELGEHHMDPVNSALRRRGLALAAEDAQGEPLLVGAVEERVRRIWEVVAGGDGFCAKGLAARLRVPPRDARDVLADLHSRRLLLRQADEYLHPGRVVSRRVGPEEG